MTLLFVWLFGFSGVLCAVLMMVVSTRHTRLLYTMMWVFWIFAGIVALFGVS